MFLLKTACCVFAMVSRVQSLRILVYDNETETKTSKIPYGVTLENIDYEGAGGIYAGLIRNRAFQGSNKYSPCLDGWSAINGTSITIANLSNPLSMALPFSLTVAVNKAHKSAGFINEGEYEGKFEVKLQNIEGTEVFATTKVESKARKDQWVQYEFTITPTGNAPNRNNTFAITFDPEGVRGDSLNFLISLFPPTYKGRKSGLIKELAKTLETLNPRFLRFPGGDAFEGPNIANPWRWKETIAPLKDRPGRPGTWEYRTSDGLGLFEYFEWCEDNHLEPILTVRAGLTRWVGHTRQPFPCWARSVDEALFMIGTERNGDHILGSAYARALRHRCNTEGFSYSVCMIAFCVDPEKTMLSTSYYIYKLISSHQTSHLLETAPREGSWANTTFWVAGRDQKSGKRILKIENYGTPEGLETNISVAFASGMDEAVQAELRMLTGLDGDMDYNDFADETKVVAEDVRLLDCMNGSFNFRMPRMSVAVLVVDGEKFRADEKGEVVAERDSKLAQDDEKMKSIENKGAAKRSAEAVDDGSGNNDAGNDDDDNASDSGDGGNGEDSSANGGNSTSSESSGEAESSAEDDDSTTSDSDGSSEPTSSSSGSESKSTSGDSSSSSGDGGTAGDGGDGGDGGDESETNVEVEVEIDVQIDADNSTIDIDLGGSTVED